MIYDALILPFSEFIFMRRALIGCLALSVSAAPIGVFYDAKAHEPNWRCYGARYFARRSGWLFTLGVIAVRHDGWRRDRWHVGRVAGGVHYPYHAVERRCKSGRILFDFPGVGCLDYFYARGKCRFITRLIWFSARVECRGVATDGSYINAFIIYVIHYLPLTDYGMPRSIIFALGKQKRRLCSLQFHRVSLLNLVGGFHALGTLMAVGLMILPSAAAHFWANNISRIIFISVCIAFISSVSGLLVSYHFNLPSGPAIILSAGALYSVSVVLGTEGSLRTRYFSQPLLEHS